MGAGRLVIAASLCVLALSAAMPAAAPLPAGVVGVQVSQAASKDVRSAANALRRAKTAQRRARRADKRAKQALRVARRLVTSAKILDGAVTAADIADGAVQASEIATDAVGAAEIAPDAVGSSELAANAVSSAEILTATIVGGAGGDIAPETITAGELAVDAVGASEIAPDAVGPSELAPGAVTAAEISANSIAIEDIAQSVWSSAHAAGTLAGRPAAASSNDGFLYFATNDNGGTLYRSNGSSWVKVAPGATQAPATPENIAMVTPDDANVTWSGMPSAPTEFMSSPRYRTKYDLSNASQARIVVRVQVAGAGAAEIGAQYATDELAAWDYLDGSSGPSVNVGSSGTKVSPWVSLAGGAKADVYLRIVGLNGAGVGTDTTFGQISIQARQ
jgi:hypothetical protein